MKYSGLLLLAAMSPVRSLNTFPVAIKRSSVLYRGSRCLYERNTVVNFDSKRNVGSDSCLVDLNESDDLKSKKVESLKLLAVTLLSSTMLAAPLPLAKQIAIYGGVKRFNVCSTFNTVFLISALSTVIPRILNTKVLTNCSSKARLSYGAMLRHVCLWPVEQNMLGSLVEGSLDSGPFYLARLAHCCREALTLKCDTQNNCGSIRDKFSSYLKLSFFQAMCEQYIIPTQTHFYKVVLSRLLFLFFLREVIKLNALLVTNVSNYLSSKFN